MVKFKMTKVDDAKTPFAQGVNGTTIIKRSSE